MIRSTLLILALSIALAAGQIPPYLGQCGGIDYTGTTTCVSGTVCTELDPFYYQCLPEAPPPTSISSVPTSTNS
ncbi:hypothetical protein DFH07DRAFT_855825 [Mycena maculata]|uniref:CBM1 domain-containing protein n=1 Tax=Mycena maculata TaxID=230809 RepID=A0AAD7HM77_9AGAR|nr:hypothetical protein DFH07DRAFT_855825 [Mycena maculata]